MFHQLSWLLNVRKLSKVRLIVLDVDGVLTDGGLWFSSSGELIKRFDVRDGLGIMLLKEYGIEVAFLSGGKSGAIEIRAKDLGITNCYVEVKNKANVLIDLQKSLNLIPSETIFLGDDLNDLVLKPYVSLLISTSDGSLAFRKKSHLLLRNRGGYGAVRELADNVLTAKGLISEIEQKGWVNKND